ncbi:uncharacterized protein LOC144596393 [Rhinoraja longicauda]
MRKTRKQHQNTGKIQPPYQLRNPRKQQPNPGRICPPPQNQIQAQGPRVPEVRNTKSQQPETPAGHRPLPQRERRVQVSGLVCGVVVSQSQCPVSPRVVVSQCPVSPRVVSESVPSQYRGPCLLRLRTAALGLVRVPALVSTTTTIALPQTGSRGPCLLTQPSDGRSLPLPAPWLPTKEEC